MTSVTMNGEPLLVLTSLLGELYLGCIIIVFKYLKGTNNVPEYEGNNLFHPVKTGFVTFGTNNLPSSMFTVISNTLVSIIIKTHPMANTIEYPIGLDPYFWLLYPITLGGLFIVYQKNNISFYPILLGWILLFCLQLLF